MGQAASHDSYEDSLDDADIARTVTAIFAEADSKFDAHNVELEQAADHAIPTVHGPIAADDNLFSLGRASLKYWPSLMHDGAGRGHGGQFGYFVHQTKSKGKATDKAPSSPNALGFLRKSASMTSLTARGQEGNTVKAKKGYFVQPDHPQAHLNQIYFVAEKQHVASLTVSSSPTIASPINAFLNDDAEEKDVRGSTVQFAEPESDLAEDTKIQDKEPTNSFWNTTESDLAEDTKTQDTEPLAVDTTKVNEDEKIATEQEQGAEEEKGGELHPEAEVEGPDNLPAGSHAIEIEEEEEEAPKPKPKPKPKKKANNPARKRERGKKRREQKNEV